MLSRRWLVAVLLMFAVSTGFAASKKVTSPKLAAKTPPALVLIELGHKLDEEQAERLQSVIDAFNAKYSQIQQIQVRLLRRVEGAPPKHLNLLSRDEYAQFAARKTSFKAMGDLLREAKQPFDARKLSPELLNDFIARRGQLRALPLAFSTPILYINKALFRKAGLDPDSPPTSWRKMQEIAGKLYSKGIDCPFATSWPVWVMLDNTSVWNGAPLTDRNGRLAFGALAQIKHIAMMATWHKAGYFRTFGVANEADFRFAQGECAMLTSASSLYPVLRGKRRDAGNTPPATLQQVGSSIDVGVSALPWHDDVHGAPRNTLADGMSLWAANNLPPKERNAIAHFVNYLLSPEAQVDIGVNVGFFPMTQSARAALESHLLKEELAALRVAQSQLKRERLEMPRIRPAQIEGVRHLVEMEFNAVWANVKPAKEALETAAQRGNEVLKSQKKLLSM